MQSGKPSDNNAESPMTGKNHLDLEMAEQEGEMAVNRRRTPCFLCCLRCCRFFCTKHHPLPSEPTLCQRVAFAFRCPAHGLVGAFLTGFSVILCLYLLLLVLTGPELAFPGRCEPINDTDGGQENVTSQAPVAISRNCSGKLFGLFALFVCAMLGGLAVSRWLPPLLGMLVVGFLLENVPYINVARTIDHHHSSMLRNAALCVILIRAGLGLDPTALRKLSGAVLRLAFTPCLTEACVWGVVAHFLLHMPFQWGFMCGFVLAAVSPAVVVPCMLRLEERRLGTDKGIPTLVIAAASVDDVLAITGFGVLLAVTFSTSSVVLTVFRGPLEALLGIAYGVVVGALLWCLPYKQSNRFLLYRFLLLFGSALIALAGSTSVELPGAGALGCLTVSFVAGIGWRRLDDWNDEKNPLNAVFATLWWIVQPFLFGLIGAEVKLEDLEANKVAFGILTLFIGLGFRMVASFLAVLGTGLSLRERFFISIAWVPKATVQAAIGPVALETAWLKRHFDLMSYGRIILTCAVLAVLIAAPLGAFFIDLTAPYLLLQEAPKVAPATNQASEDSEGE